MMQRWPKTMSPQPTPSRAHGILETFVLGLALLVVSAVAGGKSISAQTQAQRTAAPAQQQNTAAKPVPGAIVEQPPVPISPAKQPPKAAKVSWNSRGLKIEASNSSLNQILHQVAADTGAKLEGLTEDQRVFGSYGPGPTTDVLLKLLDGSGYNVFMIGGRDADTPLEIVLSARLPVSPQTAANNQNRSDSEHLQPEPQQNSSLESLHPQTIQDPFSNGEPPRDPKEFMQEILQRQQRIDQQQQQQDKQNNPQQ
jgi:hypothetical protein